MKTGNYFKRLLYCNNLAVFIQKTIVIITGTSIGQTIQEIWFESSRIDFEINVRPMRFKGSWRRRDRFVRVRDHLRTNNVEALSEFRKFAIGTDFSWFFFIDSDKLAAGTDMNINWRKPLRYFPKIFDMLQISVIFRIVLTRNCN
jgi:hypothetical protein